ncbi:MAG: sulfotransferase [Bacteroidetes bacterium]|nr:sulfotransferase [Bacteroidota bacterium]
MELEFQPKEFPTPIFITGCMRSGTTLLVDAVTEHPQLLRIGYELNNEWTLIGGAPCGVDAYGPCEYRDESHMKPEYASNMTYTMARYMKEARSWNRTLLRMKFRMKNGSGGVYYDWKNLIPVNKSVHLINKIKYLNAMYPGCKFIHIIRDIYSQSYSQKVHFDKMHSDFKGRVAILPEGGGDYWTRIDESAVNGEDKSRRFPDNFELLPEAWLRMNHLACSELNEVASGRNYIVSFEKLATDGPTVLQDIFNFLNLDPKHESKAKKIAYRQRKQYHTNTGKDPLTIWKEMMTPEETALVDSAIGMHRDKYDFITSSLR